MFSVPPEQSALFLGNLKVGGRGCDCWGRYRPCDLERYHRGWNLRLHGVPEQKQEDTPLLDICCAVTGETCECFKGCFDVTHCLGCYQDNQRKPRPVIIQFATRSACDLVWRKAKSYTFLKDNHLRFTEDLTADDRVLREKLWPIIDKARKEGKRAYFAGIRVIIEGKEVHPPTNSSEGAGPALLEVTQNP